MSVGVESTGFSGASLAVGMIAAPSAGADSGSSSSSMISSPVSVYISISREYHRKRRTISIDLRMFPEAVLHCLEFVNAIDAFWLLLRKHKTGKSFSELKATRTVCHTAQARTIPVDFACNRVECAPRLCGVGCVFLGIWLKKCCRWFLVSRCIRVWRLALRGSFSFCRRW